MEKQLNDTGATATIHNLMSYLKDNEGNKSDVAHVYHTIISFYWLFAEAVNMCDTLEFSLYFNAYKIYRLEKVRGLSYFWNFLVSLYYWFIL